jgi:hypothetical protein
VKVLQVILVLAVSQATLLVAQVPSDSLRVQLRTGSGWLYGRLIRSDSANLYLRSQPQNQTIALAGVQRVQVWRHQNVATMALAAGIGSAAGAGLFYLVSPNSEPLAGSKAGSVAAAGAAGAVGGVIAALIRPNVWVRVRPAGGGPAASGAATRRSQRVLWGAILGVTYLATIAGDVANGGLDFPELFVPAAGPFIAMARYDKVISPFYTGRNAEKVLFAASGAVQTISLVMLIKNLGGGDGRRASSLERMPAVSLMPTGRGGFALSYRSRF